MRKENLKNAFDFLDEIKSNFSACEKIDFNYYSLLGDISIALVEYRMQHNMSQSDLAKKIGISQAMISRYEKADHNVSLKSLNELFGKLDIKLSLSFVQNDEPVNSPMPEPIPLWVDDPDCLLNYA